MRGLALVVMLVGCNPTSGVQINVEPIDGVTEIRAYIGTGMPTKITSARPLAIPGEPKLTGSYFARDPSFDDELLQVAPDQPARFVYTGSGTIAAFVAVGYDHGVPVAVVTHFGITLPSDHFDIYDLPLAKATLPGAPSALQLEVWDASAKTPPPQASCVGVQDTTPAADPTFPSVYIVNPGDPDCDGASATSGNNECPGDELTYFGETPLQRGQRDQIHCAIDNGPQCMLGGPPCIDAPMSADPNLCLPAAYCASSDLCACGSPELDCEATAAVSISTGIACRINATVDADPTKVDLCPGMGSIALDAQNLLPPNAKCSSPGIFDVTSHKFVKHVPGPPDIVVSLSGACTFQLAITDPMPIDPQTGQIATGVIVVDIDADDGPHNGLALPVELDVTTSGSCSAAISCTFSGKNGEPNQLQTCTSAMPLSSL